MDFLSFVLKDYIEQLYLTTQQTHKNTVMKSNKVVVVIGNWNVGARTCFFLSYEKLKNKVTWNMNWLKILFLKKDFYTRSW